MLAAYRRSISRRLPHARLRHLGACSRISRMLKTKRVALSVRVSEHARDALYRKAEREGHRYPLAFAASLLERALDGDGESDWLVALRGFARMMGANVSVDGPRVVLCLGPVVPRMRETMEREIRTHAPPPAGVMFEVTSSLKDGS